MLSRRRLDTARAPIPVLHVSVYKTKCNPVSGWYNVNGAAKSALTLLDFFRRFGPFPRANNSVRGIATVAKVCKYSWNHPHTPKKLSRSFLERGVGASKITCTCWGLASFRSVAITCLKSLIFSSRCNIFQRHTSSCRC
jgi:hypothetical protein